MDIYAAGSPVVITLNLESPSGVSLSGVTDASYVVLDENDTEVLSATSITVDESATSVDITVGANDNKLADASIRGFRRVILTFTYQTLSYTAESEYVLESGNLLIPYQNSVLSYADAIMLASSVPNMDYFLEASKRERINALTKSFAGLSRIWFRLLPPRHILAGYDQSHIWWGRDPYWDFVLSGLKEIHYAHFPKHFSDALKLAQVLDANEALDTNSLAQKRASGLLSETIGESSMMFNSNKTLGLEISQSSYNVLKPYMVWDVFTGRAS